MNRLLLLFISVNLAFSAATEEPRFIKSAEDNFIWPLPPTWTFTQSMTKSQYAAKTRTGDMMTCTLLIGRPKEMTLDKLLTRHDADNQYTFKAIKSRYNESEFLSSYRSKLGSQDAVVTEVIYHLINLDVTQSVYLHQVVTVRKGIVYVLNFECFRDKIDEGKKKVRELLAGFSFLE